MVQILPPKPNIGRDIGQGIARGISSGFEQNRENEQSQQLRQSLGSIADQSQENMSQEQKFLNFAKAIEGSKNADKLMGYYLQSLKQDAAQKPSELPQEANPAYKALDQLESLIGQEGIGFLGHINQSEKARFNKGKFKSLQAAILPLFKSMFPRGMTEKEFKFIQENYVPQYNDTEEKIKGKIEGLRQLMSDQSGKSSPIQQQQNQEKTQQAIVMKDQQGNIYDIPPDMVENARKKGLMPQ